MGRHTHAMSSFWKRILDATGPEKLQRCDPAKRVALGCAVLRDVELVADRLPVRPCEVALEHGVGVLCMLLHVLDPKSLQNAIPGRTLHLHILYEPTRAGTRV